MSFPRYSAYKDSGVEWLGEVPCNWQSWRLSHAFGVIGSGTTPPSNEPQWYEEGATPWVTTSELREVLITDTVKSITDHALRKFSALRVYPAGSLVIAMYGATIGRLGILGVAATTNQACCVLCQPQHLQIRFCFYWFQGFREKLVAWYATGGGQPNINQQILAELRIPAPSLDEQAAIVTFLDRETAKIDALVADYRTLIDLLQEKRQAVISHAVTKGLDSTAPMKDSGVEWLGEVPEHWEVKPLKFIAIGKGGDGIQIGPYGSMLTDIQYDEPSSCKVYGQENVISGDFDRGNRWAPDSTRYSLQGYEVEPGDILFTRKGSIGQCAIVPAGISPGVIDSDTIRLRLDEAEVLNGFITLGFRSAHYVQAQVQVMKTGAILSGLNSSTIASLRFAVPLRSEQTQILDYLADEIGKIGSLITDAQDAINLLQERRTALISAAVTGKIDVRGLVETESA